MGCLVEAFAVKLLGLERDGDMIVVWDNPPPLNCSLVLRGPGNVGFTEIKRVVWWGGCYHSQF